MQSDVELKFRQIVMTSPNLPAWVRDDAASTSAVEQHVLDRSYIAFLEEQIDLSPRGPEWTDVLRQRRDALANHCGKPLISGMISSGLKRCSIKIDPEAKQILYWEIYEMKPLHESI